jgi:hypothetical protein
MFLHPIVYWKYPDSMVEIVGKRLPKFTKEQYQMIKGSIDYLGVNQYTAYYMYDPKQPKQNVIGYQMDWNVGFACKLLYALRLQSHLFFYLAYSVDVGSHQTKLQPHLCKQIVAPTLGTHLATSPTTSGTVTSNKTRLKRFVEYVTQLGGAEIE